MTAPIKPMPELSWICKNCEQPKEAHRDRIESFAKCRNFEPGRTTSSDPMMPRFRGAHFFRIDRDRAPDIGWRERIYLDEWRKENERARGTSQMLPLLLGEEPTDRDWYVAATLMQWLGTNVGRAVLHSAQERVAIEQERRDEEQNRKWRESQGLPPKVKP